MEQLTKKSPRSWKATAQTAWLWSVTVCLHFSLETSQTFTVKSPEHVATSEPRGWKATPLTQSLWPSPLSTNCPSGIDHNFHVWSSQAVATTGIVGWNATLEMAPMWPLNAACFFMSATLAGSKLEFKNGLVRSSLGQGAIFVFRDVWSSNVSLPEASGSSRVSEFTWLSCFCRLSHLDRNRSRSKRISIFSFIATSYLWRNSVSVGSYCS
mmetsp:Transcript_195/g.427  ORF Transcript_195/g.427 Transcript_195/m.427 type:complete len:211 (+) Transcript_195:679-1311(+)